MRARQLLSYTRLVEAGANGSGPSIKYSIDLCPGVLEEVLVNFADLPIVLPVLSVGQNQIGRSIILDKLVAKSYPNNQQPEGESVSFFKYVDNQPEGVYIWPHPVKLGDQNLLLIKMSGIDFEDEDEERKLLVKKVLYCLFAVTSVCFICVDQSRIFSSLKHFEGIYEDMSSRSGLKMSKFFTFAKEKDIFKPGSKMAKTQDEHQAGAYGAMTEFLYRGAEGISETCFAVLIEKLANPEVHMQFATTHQASQVMGSRCMADALSRILKAVLRVARLDMDYSHMVDSAIHFNNPNYENEIRYLEKLEESCKMFKHATALKLFQKTAWRCELNQDTLNKLAKNFQNDVPTVVMTCIGHQGEGKSTLENRIIQFTFKAKRGTEFFEVGNTGNETTINSEVLSHPLPCFGNDNQLMLVDLEGLRASNVKTEEERVMQEKLVSNVLTVSSVVCIIISNDEVKLAFAKEMVMKISCLNNQHEFKIERIYFLFHDKNIDAEFNKDVETLARDLNRDYFRGNQVIIILNKPDFNTNSAECEKFLSILMKECCNLPKRNAQNVLLNVEYIFYQIALICAQTGSDSSIIKLNDLEKRESEHLVEEKIRDLKKSVATMQSDGQTRLVDLFDKELSLAIERCSQELEDSSPNFVMCTILALKLKTTTIRVHLSEIENMYNTVNSENFTVLTNRLKEKLRKIYKSSISSDEFQSLSNKLKASYDELRKRYPQSEEVTQLLNVYQSCEYELTGKWTSLNNQMKSIEKAETESTSVFLAALEVAQVSLWMTVAFAEVPVIGELSGLNFIGSLLLGTFSGAANGGIKVYKGVFNSIVRASTASKELPVPALNVASNVKKSQKAIMRGLKAMSSVPFVIVVAVTIKGIRPSLSRLLSGLLSAIDPIETSESTAFSDETTLQMSWFEHRATKGLLAYVVLEKTPTDLADSYAKIAGCLLSEPSIGCFSVGASEETGGYYHRVFEHYKPTEEKQQSLVICRTRSPDDSEVRRLTAEFTRRNTAQHLWPIPDNDADKARCVQGLVTLLNNATSIRFGACVETVNKVFELLKQSK